MEEFVWYKVANRGFNKSKVLLFMRFFVIFQFFKDQNLVSRILRHQFCNYRKCNMPEKLFRFEIKLKVLKQEIKKKKKFNLSENL